jgi:hypothetical protein
MSTLQLVHHHPGRLRLRAKAFRENPSLVEQVSMALRELEAVTTVRSNPETGSLLIEYEPGHFEPDDLVRLVSRTAGFERIRDATAEQHDPGELVQSLAEGGQALNRFVGRATEGRADLRSLIPIGLAAAGIYSFARWPVFPRWDKLVMWSYQLFISMNADVIRPESGGRA